MESLKDFAKGILLSRVIIAVLSAAGGAAAAAYPEYFSTFCGG
jgi:hypothetical protein